MTIISIVLAVIFVSLALLHFYWMFGGVWGFDIAMPTREDGQKVINPTQLESALVGLFLSAFGLFYLIRLPMMTWELPELIQNYGGWIIPAIFSLRAMGDFKYVGFFKKIRHTKFALADTRYFSPGCLGLGVLGGLIQWLS